MNNIMNVIYIVGAESPTSIPLEVAQFIGEENVQFIVAAYYKNASGKTSGFNVPVIQIGARGKIDPQGPRRLYAYIREIQPDIIHVHHTVSAVWGALLGKMFGAQVIRTVHNDHRHNTIYQHLANAISFTFTDRVICNSKDTYANLQPWEKRLVGKFEIVHNGIDVERIDQAKSAEEELRHMIGVGENKIVVGSVGRLIPQKNYKNLLRAWSVVLDRVPEARLVIIGDGALREDLKRLADALEIASFVTFAGEHPRDTVYALLHTIDMYVMPSRWEGFCNAVVEAMAAGNPVVSSDISTLREVVGEVATYVNPEEPNDIAHGIIEVLRESPESWYERGQACRQRAIERYSVERTAEQYIRNYRMLAGQERNEEEAV